MAESKKREKKSASSQWVEKKVETFRQLLRREAETIDFTTLDDVAREHLEHARRDVVAFCERAKRGAFLQARLDPDAVLSDFNPYSHEFLRDMGNAFYESEKQRRDAGATDALLYKPKYRGLYFSTPARPDFVDYTHWLAQFRSMHNGQFLREPILVVEMIAHRVAAPDLATEFWSLVFNESQTPDHATRVLGSWLRLHVGPRWEKPNPVMVRRKTASAWKQFRLF